MATTSTKVNDIIFYLKTLKELYVALNTIYVTLKDEGIVEDVMSAITKLLGKAEKDTGIGRKELMEKLSLFDPSLYPNPFLDDDIYHRVLADKPSNSMLRSGDMIYEVAYQSVHIGWWVTHKSNPQKSFGCVEPPEIVP